MRQAPILAVEIPDEVGPVPARVRRPLRAYALASVVSTTIVIGVGYAVATAHGDALIGFVACLAVQGGLRALKRVRRRPGTRRGGTRRPEAYTGSDPEAGLPEGMAGRRAFLEHLERRFASAADTAQPLTLLILGAHRRGTVPGKLVFEASAGDLASDLRWPRDLLGSVGESRFAFGFPDTTPERAWTWAERIRGELLFHLRQRFGDIELSMGYACTDPGVRESFTAFYQRAHRAFQLACESEEEPILRAARPVAMDELEKNPVMAGCPPEVRDLAAMLTGSNQRALDRVVVHRVAALVTYAQFYLANGQLAAASEAEIRPWLDAYVQEWEQGYGTPNALAPTSTPARNQVLAQNVVHFVTNGTTALERVVAERLLALQAFVSRSAGDGTLAKASPQEIAIRLDLCASGITTSTQS